jgi:hypothetical protein
MTCINLWASCQNAQWPSMPCLGVENEVRHSGRAGFLKKNADLAAIRRRSGPELDHAQPSEGDFVVEILAEVFLRAANLARAAG